MTPAFRRRAAGAVLLIGAAWALTSFSENSREETTLVFRFDPELSTKVQKLSASWTPVGDIEPSGGVTLTFAAGPSRELRHKLTAMRGDYVIAMQIEPAEAESAVGETALVRRVTLSGTDVVIPLARGRE